MTYESIVNKLIDKAVDNEEAGKLHFLKVLQHALEIDSENNHALLHLYRHADERKRAVIDEAFIALCCHSLPALAAMAIKRADGMSLRDAFAPDGLTKALQFHVLELDPRYRQQTRINKEAEMIARAL